MWVCCFAKQVSLNAAVGDEDVRCGESKAADEHRSIFETVDSNCFQPTFLTSVVKHRETCEDHSFNTEAVQYRGRAVKSSKAMLCFGRSHRTSRVMSLRPELHPDEKITGQLLHM